MFPPSPSSSSTCEKRKKIFLCEACFDMFSVRLKLFQFFFFFFLLFSILFSLFFRWVARELFFYFSSLLVSFITITLPLPLSLDFIVKNFRKSQKRKDIEFCYTLWLVFCVEVMKTRFLFSVPQKRFMILMMIAWEKY